MVTEYAKYGSFMHYIAEHSDKVGSLNEDKVRFIMMQLLIAVDQMHKKGIIHRDIKLENILVCEQDEVTEDKQFQVCLADFGFACSDDDAPEVLHMRCGTPNYLDPEVLKGGAFTRKSDIFSLGSVMFTLLSGLRLFPGEDSFQILINNETKDPT
jgi:calcium/calmodulin-dependent protein kinase I